MSHSLPMAITLKIPPILTPKPPPKSHPNPSDSIIKHHANLKNDLAILSSYTQLQSSLTPPSPTTLPTVLKSCARLRNLPLAQCIHSSIITTNLIADICVATALIDFYCKCGFLDDARRLFDEMPERDLVTYNAMVSGYSSNGRYGNVIDMVSRMHGAGLRPNAITVVSVLSACGEMTHGKEVHCYCLRNGLFDSAVHVGTALIGFYSRFSSSYSRSVFESMVVRNAVSWNAVIYASYNEGDVDGALGMFVRMLRGDVSPDEVTFLAVVQSCGELGSLEVGKQVHQSVIKYGFSSDDFVGNALVDMYGKCGCSESAYSVFEKMPRRDIASWNAMLSVYKNCFLPDVGFCLFKSMRMEGVEGNMVTLATLLSMCTEYGDLGKGKQMHAYIIKRGMERNFTIEHALVSMYSDCDCMTSADIIFHGMGKREAVTWNTFISGLVRNEMTTQAFGHFIQMQQSETTLNSYTMVSLLKGCKDESNFIIGRSIHGYILRKDLDFNSSLRTALTDMYMDTSYESAALCLFWSSDRDVVSWNAMIASYIRNGKPNEAFYLLNQMIYEVKPNSSTMISLLLSCAKMANLPQGRCLHAFIVRRELDVAFHTSFGNALLTMYAKCGSITNAERVFRKLRRKDIISWNAMISAYGVHGRGEDALCMFYEMLKVGQSPTTVTFISVLSACSHSGLIEEGWNVFQSMSDDYNVSPEVVHYSCMVDLLGRAGSIDEASDLIESMQVEPDASLWRALLAACRVFSNIQLVRIIAGKLIELEPGNVGNYILLSNIYATAGSWEDVKILRAKIKEMGLRKTPGSSWMVIKNQVHPFTAGELMI